jgi:CTP:molybdopterin cytidylyltransferase MocA
MTLNMPRLTAVVLAAGFSRRFGSAKQLFVVDGEPLVRRAARIAREVAPAVVVIPAAAPLIREALRDVDVAIVENADAEEGVASSIRAGVAACDGDVLLLVCDQPGVDAAHLRALVDARAPLAASGYDGTFGVPAFFSARYRDELLALRGDTGAKRVLLAHANDVAVIPLRDSADLDVPP